MKKIIITLFISFWTIFIVHGQQEIILSKYTYNSLFFNPAYAGSHGPGEATVLIHYRNQWAGLDGAPKTILAAGEASIFDNSVGVGLSIGRESIGVESRSDIAGNASYRLRMGDGYLSGGLRAAFSLYADDFSLLTIKDPADVFDDQSYNTNVFTAGMGLYYNSEDMFLGFAIPNMGTVSSAPGFGERRRHYYFNVGFMAGDEYSPIRFEPSILLKFEKSIPLQYTFGLNAWLTEDLAIGGHYRSNDALALSFEWHIDNIRIGAAYDFTLSDIRHYSHGSLEIFAGYRFNLSPNDPRVKNLRYGGRF